MLRRFGRLAAIGLTSISALLGAQQPASIVVRVRVVDTSGVPIAGANVFVLRGLQDVLGSGPTDSAGVRQLSVARGAGEYQLTARRIGYQRADRFFAAPHGDTVALQLELRRTVQTLAPVTVAAREDVKRKSYHVDADDIANSSRPIFDAWDVLTKLRPDMLLGRSRECPLEHVWVNGRRVFDYSPNAMVMARRPMVSTAPIPKGSRPPPAPKLSAVAVSGHAILASIKPEHIAEINYADCFDKTVERLGGQNAAFVVLKSGIDFEVGIGSFVQERFADSLPAALPPISVTSPAAPSVDSVVAYRHRILGVFDQVTGEPVPGVEVIDLATGMKAITTRTGTISLAYLADGGNTVRLHKAGYADLDIEVTIAPTATVPITMVLAPKP